MRFETNRRKRRTTYVLHARVIVAYNSRQMKKSIALGLVLAATALAQQYTKHGELLMPRDYRQWVFLSSGIGMSYTNAPVTDPNFENVYVNPVALKGFLKTGTWPDKTVLFMEVRASGSHASNAAGKFQTSLVGFEAHVKDASRGGWAFYGIAKDAQSGKPFPKTAACFTCHSKNGATDSTFVQFYPTLIGTAKKMGTYKDTGDVQ
jgi:cytochrome c553